MKPQWLTECPEKIADKEKALAEVFRHRDSLRGAQTEFEKSQARNALHQSIKRLEKLMAY
ncbi:MAG: hypothetical protein ACN2B6_11485 [Rickettsiales bacterium]